MHQVPTNLPNADLGVLVFLGCTTTVFAAFSFALYVLMSPTVLKDSQVTSFKAPQTLAILSPRLLREKMETERLEREMARVMNAEMKLASAAEPAAEHFDNSAAPAKRAEARSKPRRMAARTRVVARAPNNADGSSWDRAPQASMAWAQRPWASYW
jgi:hypothetical protein